MDVSDSWLLAACMYGESFLKIKVDKKMTKNHISAAHFAQCTGRLLIGKTSIMKKRIILAIIFAFTIGFLSILLASFGLWVGLKGRETTPEEGTKGQGNNTGTGHDMLIVDVDVLVGGI